MLVVKMNDMSDPKLHPQKLVFADDGSLYVYVG